MMINLILCITAITLFSPLMILISVLIYLEDFGTVFFIQERVGLRETNFSIIKFRTILNGKITFVGKFLRQTGLDELPQLFNILLGDMNLVGPRPLTKEDIQRLGFGDIRFAKRWSVKPGLTGLAQIYPSIGKKISICFDFSYIKTRSFYLDFQILSFTFLMNIFGKRKLRKFLYTKLKNRIRVPNWKNWFKYFKKNSDYKILEEYDTSKLTSKEKFGLKKSLAIFQIGETGEGRIAKEIDEFHSKYINNNYKEALKLFVKEEGRHARILSNMIRSLEGKNLEFNFTEKLFKIGRRILGVKLKLLVLLVAETISVEFYKFYAKKLPLSGLRASLIRIIKEEEKHLDFHSEFFKYILKNQFEKFLFSFIFLFVSIIAYLMVVKDHYQYLKIFGFDLKESFWSYQKIVYSTINKALNREEKIQIQYQTKLI